MEARQPFGELLKEHRLSAGLSQEELAERAHLSVVTISALERGARQRPYIDTIAQLAAALNLSQAARRELEHAAARHSPVAVPSRAPSEAITSNDLPTQLSKFVGRKDDVAKVQALIAQHRLVTLVGAGGIGKTRIALHVAADLLAASEEGVWFVDFATLTDGSLVAETVASALEIQLPPGRPSIETLVAYLKSKRLIVILDNCEHLINEVARLADTILQRCRNVQILATSREALGLSGERTYRVPSLDVPSPDELHALRAQEALNYGAIALFVDRAEAADTRFALTDELVPTVAEICRRLDGIALAIELAAARVNALSATTLAQNLRHHFLVLTGGSRTALPRHKTMRALIEWSYELLSAKEQLFLRRLSIFSGGFTLELITALYRQDDVISQDEVLELLASVVNKSLVQTEAITDATARYRLLESTRQYAFEKLQDAGEYTAIARAHSLALLSLAEQFDSVLQLQPDRLWRNLTVVGVGNWRAAMEWTLEARGDVRIGQELAGSRGVSWFTQIPGESWRWVRAALQTCDENTLPSLRAKLELAHSRFATALSQLESKAAVDAAERALLLYREAGDHLGIAEALSYLGLSEVFRHRIAEGKSMLLEALETAQTNNAQWLIGITKHALGIAHTLEGDLETSRLLFRETLALFKTASCDRYAAQVAVALAETEYLLGNIETAVQLSREAAEVLRANRNWTTLANVLSNLGAFLIAANRFEDARRDAREGVILAHQAGISVCVAAASQHLAAIAALRPDSSGQRLVSLQRAARVLGFVNGRFHDLEHERQNTDQQEYDKALTALRNEFGSRADELMEEGTHWPEDRAVAEALKI